jgi:hypothetical protein
VTTCRTLDEVIAAAKADAADAEPLSQDQADLVAALLAPHWRLAGEVGQDVPASQAGQHRKARHDHDD